MKIDNSIDKDNCDWKFDKEVVKIFDNHVRKSVPMYDEFHRMIADLSQWYVESGTNVYDIGTSTGEGLKNLIDLHSDKNINFIGVDESVDMFSEAQKRFDKCLNISLINGDICSQDISVNNASFITSILTMQFIAKRKRNGVFEKIYKGLNNGGAFILVEKVVGENAIFDEIFIELYHDFKLKQGFSQEEIFAKSRAIRGVMRPNTLNENINSLRTVGFKDVDIFFKWCNFVGIIAIK